MGTTMGNRMGHTGNREQRGTMEYLLESASVIIWITEWRTDGSLQQCARGKSELTGSERELTTVARMQWDLDMPRMESVTENQNESVRNKGE